MTPNVGYPVNFHQQAINNAVFQRLGTAPASPIAGQYYVNTTDGLLYKRNEANTAWEAIGSSQVNHYNITCGAGANNLSVDNKSGIVSIKTIINAAGGYLSITLSVNKPTIFLLKDDDSNLDGFYLYSISVNGNGLTSNINGNTLTIGGVIPNNMFAYYPDFNPSVAFSISSDNLPYEIFQKANSTLGTKTTLANADEISIWDSAVSYIGKKITYTNLKAAILTIPLLGWVVGSNTAISASDTITGAFGKLQGQINALLTSITNYASSTKTLTNTTIDANGTGNSITNLETADFATNVIDNDASLTANSSTRIPTQQAVKGYVDGKIVGLSWKDSVRVATTTNGALATAFANGQVVDGVTLVTGDRIALKNQTTASENGIYTVNASGAPTRATDADSSAELKQATFMVQEGTVNADTQWTITNNGTITVGTTGLTFSQIGNGSVPDATTSTAGKVYLATSAEAKAKANVANKAIDPTALADFVYSLAPQTFGNGALTQFDFTHAFTTVTGVKIKKVSDNQHWTFLITETSGTNVRVNTGIIPTTNEFEIVISGK